MGAAASTSPDTMPVGERRLTLASALVGLGLVVAALAVTVAQVEVSDGDLGVTRACGSVFDGVTDRSGWEVWWARDLDEPDDAVRSALVRTTRCPDAINDGIVLAATLGALGVAALVVSVWRRGRRSPDADVGRRLERVGRATSIAGAGLTVLGLVAVVLLVADADSTLFLYTDRAVVAVVGLLVLVPALVLFALGRALVLAARSGAMPTPPGREDDGA